MVTFSGQGLMEMLTGLGFHVWMDTTGGYKAEKKGFKPISYKEYYDKADSIKAGGKPFKDIEAALAFARIGYAE